MAPRPAAARGRVPRSARRARASRARRRAGRAGGSGSRSPARLRPTRRPTSSFVRPSSSTSAAHARAASIGFRSSRAMFSISASSSRSFSSVVRTSAGIRSRPRAARRASGARRRSARSARRRGPDEHGLQHAVARCESASSSSSVSSNCLRGWRGLGVDQVERDLLEAAPPRCARRRQDRREATSDSTLSHVQPPPWPARSRHPTPRSADRGGSPAGRSWAPR